MDGCETKTPTFSLPTTKTPVLGTEGCVLSFLLSQPPTVPVFRGGQELGIVTDRLCPESFADFFGPLFPVLLASTRGRDLARNF